MLTPESNQFPGLSVSWNVCVDRRAAGERVAGEADTAERERGHGDGCGNERGASRRGGAELLVPRSSSNRADEHERHRGELGNGGVAQRRARASRRSSVDASSPP